MRGIGQQQIFLFRLDGATSLCDTCAVMTVSIAISTTRRDVFLGDVAQALERVAREFCDASRSGEFVVRDEAGQPLGWCVLNVDVEADHEW